MLSNIEELQSALDRANEKLQFNNSLIVDKDKEISRLSTDVDTVSSQPIIIITMILYYSMVTVVCPAGELSEEDTVKGGY